MQLSEIACARVDTPFPIVYCTDPDKEFNNDKDWEPCVLKKIGQELYEVLDANEDAFFFKEEVEYDGDDGLTSLWGSAFKYPSLAFVSTYQKKVLTSNEGGNTKTLQEPDTKKFEEADTTASSKQDVNRLRFVSSCISKCFIGEERCAHIDYFRVGWHHGICEFYLANKIFFTAQLFATPHSDLASNEHSMRNSSKMKMHIQGKLDASFVNTLMTDLYLNWDQAYSVTSFPQPRTSLERLTKPRIVTS